MQHIEISGNRLHVEAMALTITARYTQNFFCGVNSGRLFDKVHYSVNDHLCSDYGQNPSHTDT